MTVEGSCPSPDILNDFTCFLTAYTTLADVVLAALPITAFWQLRMKSSTKIGLCVMMGLTLLSAITTIIKATYLYLFSGKSDPCQFHQGPLFKLQELYSGY